MTLEGLFATAFAIVFAPIGSCILVLAVVWLGTLFSWLTR